MFFTQEYTEVQMRMSEYSFDFTEGEFNKFEDILNSFTWETEKQAYVNRCERENFPVSRSDFYDRYYTSSWNWDTFVKDKAVELYGEAIEECPYFNWRTFYNDIDHTFYMIQDPQSKILHIFRHWDYIEPTNKFKLR